MIDSEYVKYHEKLDKKSWLEEAGDILESSFSCQTAWRLKDRDNLFSISPNIRWSADRAREYLDVKSPNSILIAESIRVLRQINIEEFEVHLWFAAYQSKPISATQLQVDIEYYAIPKTEMGIGDNPVFEDVSIFKMLDIDGASELQPKQAVINKEDLEHFISESIKVLGFKSISALISSSQEAAALASGDIHLQNGACSLHMGLMDKVTRVKSMIQKMAFTAEGIPYCDTIAAWDLLFSLSVCPEIIKPINSNILHIGMGGDCDFDTSKVGYMEALDDIEGLYLVGNPIEGMQQKIQARLDSDKSPPPNSYDALANSSGDVNHYTYKILGMTVIQRRNGADTPADAPIYLYAVEECDNRYRGDEQYSIERLNNRSVWMRAEQIDTDGNVLLSGEDAFWAAGINPAYIKDGAVDEYNDYAAECVTILNQLEARYIRAIVSHAQAMQERLYSLNSVYGDTPVMPKPSERLTPERLMADKRFEILKMTDRQVAEYKYYSRAWHSFNEQGKNSKIAAAFIVIDHCPWQLPSLLEYSVITQVFQEPLSPSVACYSKKYPDAFIDVETGPIKQAFLTDRYNCSMYEPHYHVYSGDTGCDPDLPIYIDGDIKIWADALYGGNNHHTYDVGLDEEVPLLTIDILNEIIAESISEEVNRNALRLERQLGIIELDDY